MSTSAGAATPSAGRSTCSGRLTDVAAQVRWRRKERRAWRVSISESVQTLTAVSTVTLKSVAGGTRVRQAGEAKIGGFFKLAEPLVVKMGRRQFKNDVDDLRDLTDAHAL